jgi:hypothetical protein
VATSQPTWTFGRALVCAARTASAMVSELTISTTVLTAPQMTLRWLLASANPSGDFQR